MVYNTTDIRSSLNITDLTSDAEYSVTVASRDGARRLGQESEELIISLSGELHVIGYMYSSVANYFNRVLHDTIVKPLCFKQSRATLSVPKCYTVFLESVYGIFIKWKVGTVL